MLDSVSVSFAWMSRFEVMALAHRQCPARAGGLGHYSLAEHRRCPSYARTALSDLSQTRSFSACFLWSKCCCLQSQSGKRAFQAHLFFCGFKPHVVPEAVTLPGS